MSKVLTSDKTFVTYDVDFKHLGQNIWSFKIFWEKSDLPSMLFYYRKIPVENIFAHKSFIC